SLSECSDGSPCIAEHSQLDAPVDRIGSDEAILVRPVPDIIRGIAADDEALPGTDQPSTRESPGVDSDRVSIRDRREVEAGFEDGGVLSQGHHPERLLPEEFLSHDVSMMGVVCEETLRPFSWIAVRNQEHSFGA